MRYGLINAVKNIVNEEEAETVKGHSLFNSSHEGYAVIAEEFDEAQDALDCVKRHISRLWANVKSDNFKDREHSFVEVEYLNNAAVNLACEAIQIAAMANKFIESVRPK